MANIYNFGLAGVASAVQFGKGGTQLLSNSGTFSAVASDGATLVRFQIANAVNPQDAVTFQALQGVAMAANAAVGTLTTEVRGVETGAGLTAGTGAYVAPSGTQYITGATSLKNADALLDAAILAANTVLTATDAAVGLSSAGSLAPFTGSNFLAGAGTIVAALTALDMAANSGSAAVTAETARSEAAEANIAANVAMNFSTLTSNIATLNANVIADVTILNNSIGMVQANLAANVTSIYASITDTNANVAAEIVRAMSVENTISNAVAVETTRALTAEAIISGNGVSALSSLLANIATVNSNVITEAGRATTAEGNIAGNVASNFTTLTTNIATVSGNVAAEVTRATTAETTLNSNITTEVTRAEGVESALISNVAAIQMTYVKSDGSVPFVGNVSMSSIYHIQNVANPVNAGDAVNLSTLQSAISAIGSAFSYVGTIANTGTQGSPINISTILAGTGTGASGAIVPGDYWKVLTAGWLTGGTSTAFFVQANDGVVYNTTGGWDVIAHVDSVVTGAAGLIDVNGSIDTGFIVSIDSAFTNQVTVLQANVVTLAGNIATEVSRATTAEGLLSTNLTNETSRAMASEGTLAMMIGTVNGNVVSNVASLTSLINAEATRAMGVETSLGLEIDSVSSMANAAETNIAANVALIESSVGLSTTGSYVTTMGSYTSTATSVVQAIAALDAALATASSSGAGESSRAMAAEANLAANLVSNVSTLNTTINMVNANAISNATILNANIATVAGDLISNVSTLNSEINMVNTNAVTNNAAITTLFSTIETAAGLSPTGTFVTFTTTNYMNTATSLANALVLLDGETASLANTLATLSQNTITTADHLSSVLVDDVLGVVTKLDVAGSAKQVANVIAGPSTNTNLITDFTVPNTISMIANGTGTNIDIRIEPQGAGQVFIGAAGVAGVMQAEPGQTLEMAGGDMPAGNGGNLILRGGMGAALANSGIVQITDSTSNTVATFSGVANPNSFLSFVNGANAATIGVNSTMSSADLVLTPKGTGVINASSAKVINVATGIANTDAVNVGQLNTAVATAVTAAKTGVLYSATANLTEVNGDVSFGPISGTIVRVRVLVGTGFNSATNIEVGTTSAGSDLMTPMMIDGTLAGQAFVTDVYSTVTSQTLHATVASAGGSAGTATVLVEYLHA